MAWGSMIKVKDIEDYVYSWGKGSKARLHRNLSNDYIGQTFIRMDINRDMQEEAGRLTEYFSILSGVHVSFRDRHWWKELV